MNKVIIIAEAGVNHNGDINLAKKMVDAIKEAGADYIKFQTFNPEKLVSRYAQKAEYQKKETGSGETQLEMLQKLALPYIDFVELKKYCESKEIGFLSTPFDMDSIDELIKMNIDFWKIPSGEITNMPYLEKIGNTHKKIVMSTGMCNMEEIKAAVDILQKSGSGEIVLLHCNTQYPTPYEDVNLKAMKTIAMETGLQVGYSDHTKGIEVPIAAVALGAKVIEKHFTLDRNMEGPDHKASLEPNELKAMVSAIRNIEMALGDGKKTVSKSEIENLKVVRKSIVASKIIKKGETLTYGNITTKRPGTGISPMRWNEIIGTQAIRDFEEDELIEI